RMRVGWFVDEERARHVSPAAALLVPRPEVDVDRQPGRERAGAGLVPVALPHRRDDHVWRARGTMLSTGGSQRRADVFGEERLSVHVQTAVLGKCAREQAA